MRLAQKPKVGDSKTGETALLKACGKIAERLEEVVEALGEAKPPQVTVEASRIAIPEPKSAVVTVEAPARPKSADIISRTLPDGSRHHKVTFHY